MSASLAVNLANLWMKSIKNCFQKPNEGRENKTPDMKGMCIVKYPCNVYGYGLFWRVFISTFILGVTDEDPLSLRL